MVIAIIIVQSTVTQQLLVWHLHLFTNRSHHIINKDLLGLNDSFHFLNNLIHSFLPSVIYLPFLNLIYYYIIIVGL